MSGRSSELEDYSIACELNECRWEYRRDGTTKWERFREGDHKVIETAHILKEERAQINLGTSYNSRVVIDMRNRTFSRGYGSRFDIRRVVLYSPEEIVTRRHAALVKKFVANKPAKKFADALFEKFKNEPGSDDDEDDDEDGEDAEIIEDQLVEFLQEVGVDETSVQPAILFWQMNVKGFMEVSRNELYLIMQKCGAKDLSSLKAASSKLEALVESDAAYAHFYMWNFNYYRNAQQTQKKYVAVETAAQVWAQILVPRFPKMLKHLAEFLAQYKGIGISLDTWKMLLDFSKNTLPDLSNLADFYPPFVDDFVEFLVDNHGYKNPNAEPEEEEDDDDFF